MENFLGLFLGYKTEAVCFRQRVRGLTAKRVLADQFFLDSVAKNCLAQRNGLADRIL